MAVQPEYILAVDYGEKRVGLAIAHQVARLPRPLTTLPNTSQLLADIRAIIEQEAVKLVVVGLPRGMDGGYTAQTRAAEAFQQQLAAALSVPVATADETLTSVDAEAALAGKTYAKGEVDALAATYILGRYLNEQTTRSEQA
jgi:putative Holliday junction resolvase